MMRDSNNAHMCVCFVGFAIKKKNNNDCVSINIIICLITMMKSNAYIYELFFTHVIGQRFEAAGETSTIGHKFIGFGITFHFHPAIVDDHIFISSIFIAFFHNMVGCIFKQPLASQPKTHTYS